MLYPCYILSAGAGQVTLLRSGFRQGAAGLQVSSGGSPAGAAVLPTSENAGYSSPAATPQGNSSSAGLFISHVRVRLSGDVVQPLVVSGPWQAGPGETCDSVFPNMEVRRESFD
jgi:hypothetical protein